MSRALKLLLGISAPLLSIAITAPAGATASGDYTTSGVNIRTGPHVASTALGQGFPGQGAILICYTTGDTVSGNSSWDDNTDAATSVTGYSADHYLAWSGTLSRCS